MDDGELGFKLAERGTEALLREYLRRRKTAGDDKDFVCRNHPVVTRHYADKQWRADEEAHARKVWDEV